MPIRLTTGGRAEWVKLVAERVGTDLMDTTTDIGGEFSAALIRGIFDQWHVSFMQKTDGEADDDGEVWKPLAEETIQRKVRGLESGKLKGQTDRLTERSRTLTERFTAELVRQGVDAASARQRAAAWAWRAAQFRPADRVPIGIETHRLEESLQPGTAAGNNYGRSSPFQVAERTAHEIVIGTEVENDKGRRYAHWFHKMRPIFTDPQMLRWVKRAAVAALRDIRPRIQEYFE